MCLGSRQTLDNVFTYNGIILKNTIEKEISNVIMDNNLNFNRHLIRMLKIAAQKLNILSRKLQLLEFKPRNSHFQLFY